MIYNQIVTWTAFAILAMFLFAQYVGHRAHWLSVGVRTAISFSIWSEVQAAVKESPITPPPNHDWRGRKSRGGLSSPLHRAQPPPQAVAINISGSPLGITGTAVLLLLLQSIIPPITSSLPQSRSSKRLLLHFQGKWENSIVVPSAPSDVDISRNCKKIFHTIFEAGCSVY